MLILIFQNRELADPHYFNFIWFCESQRNSKINGRWNKYERAQSQTSFFWLVTVEAKKLTIIFDIRDEPVRSGHSLTAIFSGKCKDTR